MAIKFTVPGLDVADAEKLVERLQQRLVALIDLQLTLKHVHWNVVGPNFIGVHEMLDPQTEKVRLMSDDVAERIATLGGEPRGTLGYAAKTRTWDDYALDRANAVSHLGALDLVYSGVIADHRDAAGELEAIDPVTHDLLLEQVERLELFQWFVRAHVEDAGGDLVTTDAETEEEAAAAAQARA